MKTNMRTLAMVILFAGALTAPIANAHSAKKQAPMTEQGNMMGGDMSNMEGMMSNMEGMMSMMKMMAQMGPMMEQCTKMMKVMNDQPATPMEPETEQHKG